MTFRTDGLPATVAAPNGNTTTYAYDALGQLTSQDTVAGGTNRALYDWTRNRAGQVLSEASTITGDPANGTVTYGYDPLGRLTGSTISGTTTTYGWDAVPDRTSVQVGAGTAATTTYDAADRPTGGANPTASYSSDDDGRLLSRPGQQLVWDHLGRLTSVKDGSGVTLASYTYDPLDRLRLIDYGAGVRIRFRYVGLSTAVVQWLDDAAGTVTRSVGTGWSGERLLDWTGSGSNIRLYGTNAHHDVTWLASTSGTVLQALRYDPWGTPRSTVPSGYTPFRFQGSWLDDLRDTEATNDLAWVVTRWYAPSLGRFVSEDSWMGDELRPGSRHLYAFGEGEPIGRSDETGMCWKSCTAHPTNGSERLRQWREFFKRFPGVYQSCYRGHCKWQGYKGVGRGDGMLGFLQYLIDSGRISGSKWWNRVDRSIVQGSLTAWRRFAAGQPPIGPSASSANLWLKYIRYRRVNGKYIGGTWRQAWNAHQRGLWAGVGQARAFADQERYAERIFTWKVLNNVETYARTGFDLDGALGVGIILGRYPREYPATGSQACGSVLWSEDFATYVRRYYKPPSNWREYCRKFNGPRPIFVV